MYKSEIFVINMHHHRNSLTNIHINNNKDINNLYNVNANANNKNHGNYKIVSNTNNMNGYINSHANIRKKIFLNVTSKLNRS
jgi:hypothetical protein